MRSVRELYMYDINPDLRGIDLTLGRSTNMNLSTLKILSQDFSRFHRNFEVTIEVSIAILEVFTTQTRHACSTFAVNDRVNSVAKSANKFIKKYVKE